MHYFFFTEDGELSVYKLTIEKRSQLLFLLIFLFFYCCCCLSYVFLNSTIETLPVNDGKKIRANSSVG